MHVCGRAEPKLRRTSKPLVGILGDVDGRIVPVAPPPIPPRRHRPEAGNLDDSDQLIKSQLLYQLSYAGAPAIVFAESSSACCRGHRRPPALLSKLLSNRKTVVKSPGVETGKNPGVSDLVFDANRRSDQTLLALGSDSIGDAHPGACQGPMWCLGRRGSARSAWRAGGPHRR
jgi:hypothetical protein